VCAFVVVHQVIGGSLGGGCRFPVAVVKGMFQLPQPVAQLVRNHMTRFVFGNTGKEDITELLAARHETPKPKQIINYINRNHISVLHLSFIVSFLRLRRGQSHPAHSYRVNPGFSFYVSGFYNQPDGLQQTAISRFQEHFTNNRE
jgi:hypothetical protein